MVYDTLWFSLVGIHHRLLSLLGASHGSASFTEALQKAQWDDLWRSWHRQQPPAATDFSCLSFGDSVLTQSAWENPRLYSTHSGEAWTSCREESQSGFLFRVHQFFTNGLRSARLLLGHTPRVHRSRGHTSLNLFLEIHVWARQPVSWLIF